MYSIAVLSSLALAGLAIFAAVVGGRATHRADGRSWGASHVLRLDATSAAMTWGLGQGLLALASLSGLLTFAPSLWLFAGLAIGLATLVIFSWKLRLANLAGGRSSGQGFARRESTSETWQYALIAAGSAGFGSYMLGIGRLHPQFVHLGITLMVALTGYALGLAVWSPKVKSGAALSLPPEATATPMPRSCSRCRGRGRKGRR